MNVITSGRINISPFRFDFDVDLDQVLELMLNDRYDGVPGVGWGGLVVHEAGERTPGSLRQNPGTPSSTDAFGSQTILARRLVDQFNKTDAQRYSDELRESLPADYTHRLEATDVIVLDEHNPRVLISSHDYVRCQRLLDVVGPLLAQASPSDSALAAASPWLAGTSDFFLWLIYRSFNDPILSADMELLELRYVRGMNGAGQRIDIRDHAGADRAEFHATIAQPAAEFGTCKFQLLHKGLDLEVDMQMNVDGTFSPFIGTSWYRGQIDLPTNWTVQLAIDVASTVIPDLYVAHAGDQDWPSQRASFRTDSRDATAALLA